MRITRGKKVLATARILLLRTTRWFGQRAINLHFLANTLTEEDVRTIVDTVCILSEDHNEPKLVITREKSDPLERCYHLSFFLKALQGKKLLDIMVVCTGGILPPQELREYVHCWNVRLPLRSEATHNKKWNDEAFLYFMKEKTVHGEEKIFEFLISSKKGFTQIMNDLGDSIPPAKVLLTLATTTEDAVFLGDQINQQVLSRGFLRGNNTEKNHDRWRVD